MARKKKYPHFEPTQSGDFTAEPTSLPGEMVVRPGPGTVPGQKGAVKHGWHSEDAIQIPTSLTCNLCPLYHVKKKDHRHPLSCREGKMNQTCPILTRQQQQWAFGLMAEIREATGEDPVPSDNARIEQIVRHRSRIFQIENYLKVAGLIDLVKGEMRNVADRLTTTENALSRVLTEYRQSLSERRAAKQGQGPRLEDYLKEIQTKPEE